MEVVVCSCLLCFVGGDTKQVAVQPWWPRGEERNSCLSDVRRVQSWPNGKKRLCAARV